MTLVPYRDDEGRMLVQVLRALRGWDQTALARAAGLSQNSISRYEAGDTLTPEALERITGAVGLPLPWIEHRLLPILRAARAKVTAAAAGRTRLNLLPNGDDLEPADQGELEVAIRGAIATAFTRVEALTAAAEAEAVRSAVPSPLDREEAARTWGRIASCTAAERRWLVGQGGEFQTWALAERLCHESALAALKSPAAALDLARLAVSVAQLTPGDERWRRRLEGYARAFVGNAQRVAGDLVAAGAEFANAWALWREGAEEGTAVLEEWRLLDLEASLRREARQFAAAFDLLDRAAAVAPAGAAGRILIKRAVTLEQMGKVADAVAALREAEPLIANCNEPRLRWALDFNLCVNLCHLGEFAEVEMQLPRLRQLAQDLRNDLDLVRVAWLSGRVAAGCGRRGEACAIFEQVQVDWTAQDDAFGTALVSLELAQLYLEEERTAEVRDLATASAWILTAEGVKREALAAVQLFYDAARREAATIEQARAALRLLHDADHLDVDVS
jgi:transcriptional regulator with XRE-family HTH domain/tetratricopeptide (TPR) repeat protein